MLDEGRAMSNSGAENMKRANLIYRTSYNFLSEEALSKGRCRWACRPKMHYLEHLTMDFQPLNGRFFQLPKRRCCPSLQDDCSWFSCSLFITTCLSEVQHPSLLALAMKSADSEPQSRKPEALKPKTLKSNSLNPRLEATRPVVRSETLNLQTLNPKSLNPRTCLYNVYTPCLQPQNKSPKPEALKPKTLNPTTLNPRTYRIETTRPAALKPKP